MQCSSSPSREEKPLGNCCARSGQMEVLLVPTRANRLTKGAQSTSDTGSLVSLVSKNAPGIMRAEWRCVTAVDEKNYEIGKAQGVFEAEVRMFSKCRTDAFRKMSMKCFALSL
ncbi:hypothetical protein RB195_005718 [Necator americanus]|uniref:Uncharacterized protein n=1 Tax=Necator americanus TaxID=51031 RepID=A0ABR1BSD0_NECAM